MFLKLIVESMLSHMNKSSNQQLSILCRCLSILYVDYNEVGNESKDLKLGIRKVEVHLV